MRRSLFLFSLLILFISAIGTKEKDLVGKYISDTKVYIDTTVKKDWIPYVVKDSLYYAKHGMKKEKDGMRNHYSFKIELILQENHGYTETTSNDFLNVPFISIGTWRLKGDSVLLRETNTQGHAVQYSSDPTKDYDQVFVAKAGSLCEGKSCLQKVKN